MHYSAQQVLGNGGCAGVDGEDIENFKDKYKLNMRELHRQMKENRYTPSPILRTYIPKSNGKERPLGIPTIKDRIAQATVRQVTENIFERVFCDCSYGFRPNRSAHDAINKIEEYKRQGYQWVIDADIKSYFDNIDHNLLMDFVAEYISDGWVLGLIRSWLTAGIMNNGEFESTEKGTPQGGVISPLLANIYLHQFDKEMTSRGYKLVRYADDFVVLTKSKKKAKRSLEVIEEIITGKLKLTLHPDKTVITNFGKGVVFLGYEFINWRYKRPRKKAIDKFKDKIRDITRRQRPFSVEFIIVELNPVLRGWANYYKFGNVKKLFGKLDKWVRMRIRSFIEKKKAILNQNYRISNSMLEEKGLISLLTYCFN